MLLLRLNESTHSSNTDMLVVEKDNLSILTVPLTVHSSQTILAAVKDTCMDTDMEAQDDNLAHAKEWAPTKNEWSVMISLAFISLMVSLDATILVTVLPVSKASATAYI
jgi:hypothetical protein